MNIVRHFGVNGLSAAYSVCAVEDIYEVRVPRLQLLRVRNGEQGQSKETPQGLDTDRQKL